MIESSQSNPLNVDGHNQNGNWPSKDGNNAGDGKEVQEAMRQTRENMNKRPTKRLSDIGNVSTGIPSLGKIARKFNK